MAMAATFRSNVRFPVRFRKCSQYALLRSN
nr:MAG TPA: hypothetical protein [Caudoviricetes sp.]